MSTKSKKSEIITLAQNACDLLEQGKEKDFFDALEKIILQQSSASSLHPLGEEIGKRGLKKPELYFDILDKFFKKDINYAYRPDFYNTEKVRMSNEEIQKACVWGWRAVIVGIAFNQMSHKYYHEVVKRTREYIITSSHWASSDTFADKTFNTMFKERFDWILEMLKKWARDDNKWIRNAAGFAVHAPVERKILDAQQFQKALGILDLLMQDKDMNVKKKVAWALRVVSSRVYKGYPEETFEFLKKWASVDDKNTRWIIKNGMKFLEKEKQEIILKAIGQ